MKKSSLGFILMAIAGVGLAVATILMKQIPIQTGLTPGQVAIWRFAIAAPLMWVIALARSRQTAVVPKRPWSLLGLGVIYSVASLLALLSLGRLSSSLYVIIVFVYPSFVVLYSLVSGAPVPRRWWLGLPLALIGLALTLFDFRQSITADVIGVILSLLNGLAIAVYNILSAKVFKQVEDRQVGTTWVNTGALAASLFLIPIMGVAAPQTAQGWISLISLGIFGTLIPILSLNAGLQLVGAARGSLIMILQPVVAILLSTTLLAETLSLQQWLGGVLVIIAIVLLQKSPDHYPKQSSG